MFKRITLSILIISALLISTLPAKAASSTQMIGINVLLKTKITNTILKDLGTRGKVRDVVYEINALTMQIRSGDLTTIKKLPYVASANPDAVRNGAPVDTVAATNFSGGMNTWDLDAINVTEFGSSSRQVTQDGNGVFVAVLDTGLVDAWRQYFPQERIAEEYATSFGGGGGEVGNVSDQPNKWEHDQNSHGTHVTSTILGYNLRGTPVNGVAPMATVIPVKVLNQNGSGWSSVVARGIVYVTDLKISGVLGTNPVVINMSLGGSELDAMERAAIDRAVINGVIIVASAGNSGEDGMGYPGAYTPVISVAASGWVGEWYPVGNRAWWYNRNVPDPTNMANYYITDFSSRELAGQDLDVAAPGSWVVGPYQVNSGQTSYYFLGGTSMASPHVAGIVALMAQKNSGLTAFQAEAILEGSAISLPAGSRTIYNPDGTSSVVSWLADATGAGLVTADAALAATTP
ncbi:MAG: Subtilisin DY [Chloroflexi bacterium GWB2_49_20]|nr:MAG: Subtilisin DY [Chloroflexi bacterium GWB2_49_20]OGN79278.1 MAG: Subtilisin DY [Chloroflexi bacterium GWC2_49_37]OGN82952.1 MAG: Subtilisin DY [Chloroflexi bacterium GWD2_49_16]